MTADDYDPDYWSDRMTSVIGQFSGQTVTREIAATMEEQLKPLRDGQRDAVHAAFPWVETWWEDTDDFIQVISRMMSDDDARRIREVRAGGATWRYVAEWAYDNLRPS